VGTNVDSDQLFAINTVADALNAIQEITDQGEEFSGIILAMSLQNILYPK
jgi:hypothetical protein